MSSFDQFGKRQRQTEREREGNGEEREREREFILSKIKFHITAVRLAYTGRIIFLHLQIV